MRTNILIMAALALFAAGCTTTTITETTYAEDGTTVKSVKVSEISGNPLVILAQNSAAKSWCMSQSGWHANIGMDSATNSYGLNVGSVNNQMASYVDSASAVEIAKTTPAIYSAARASVKADTSGVDAK